MISCGHSSQNSFYYCTIWRFFEGWLERVFENPLDTLDAIARKRGCLMSGGHIDYNRIAVILLDEFRGGKIGNISLERVDDVLDEEENEGEV